MAPGRVETLEDKACLNLFVKEVIMRIMKGLRIGLGDINTFYKIWDEKRVVMNMSKGYYCKGVTD